MRPENIEATKDVTRVIFGYWKCTSCGKNFSPTVKKFEVMLSSGSPLPLYSFRHCSICAKEAKKRIEREERFNKDLAELEKKKRMINNIKWFLAALTMGCLLFMFSEYMGG